jgi:hypothetical protein
MRRPAAHMQVGRRRKTHVVPLVSDESIKYSFWCLDASVYAIFVDNGYVTALENAQQLHFFPVTARLYPPAQGCLPACIGSYKETHEACKQTAGTKATLRIEEPSAGNVYQSPHPTSIYTV